MATGSSSCVCLLRFLCFNACGALYAYVKWKTITHTIIVCCFLALLLFYIFMDEQCVFTVMTFSCHAAGPWSAGFLCRFPSGDPSAWLFLWWVSFQSDKSEHKGQKGWCVSEYRNETWLKQQDLEINGLGVPLRHDRDLAVSVKSLGGGLCLYVNQQ